MYQPCGTPSLHLQINCYDLTFPRQRSLLGMPDPSDVHGGLLALTQLSQAFSGSPELEVFRQEVRSRLVVSTF
jgi:hypothetical protein